MEGFLANLKVTAECRNEFAFVYNSEFSMIQLAMEKLIKEIKLGRGILFKDASVLLVQNMRPGHGHFFLPGGNVDPGEPVREALVREWQEELGWNIKPGQFLGCLENRWSFNRKQDGAQVDVFEINFLFIIETSEQTLRNEPTSKESHLKFSWVPLKQLASINLLPEPLKTLIPDIADFHPKAIWASTID